MVELAVFFKRTLVDPGGDNGFVPLLDCRHGLASFCKRLLDSDSESIAIRLFSDSEDVSTKVDYGACYPML